MATDPRASEQRPTPVPVPAGYDVLEEIGRGGFGVVVLARHRMLDRRVAIKGVLGAARSDPQVLARFQREAQVLAALAHPAIVRVYDFFVSGQDLSLLMEYVPGTSLRALLDSGPLAADRAIAVLADVAAALSCAAEHGVGHRDVKPDNVFVLPTGRAKLGDFGLARVTGDLSSFQSQAGTVIGTPAYMPPERILGVDESDVRGDAYSFAVMAYETLTGCLPFEAEDVLGMVGAQALATPRPPSDIVAGFPPAADAILLGGLSKEPARRPLPVELMAALAAVPAVSWPRIDLATSGGRCVTRQPAGAHAAADPMPPRAGVAPDTAVLRPGRASETILVRSVAPPPPDDGHLPWVQPPLFRPGRTRRRGGRWRTPLLAGVVVALLSTAVGVSLVQRSDAGDLAVLGATVSVAPPGGAGRCPGATFVFTGAIRTNGRPGALRLRWTQPDGTLSQVSTLPVPSDRFETRAVLRFSVAGSAVLRGAARLHILEPTRLEPPAVAVRYGCR